MNSSLFHQQGPTCPVHLTWMVCEMGGWCLYSCCFVRYYLTHNWDGDMRVHTFPKGISPKLNIIIIMWLEFELDYCDDAFQHISHYTIGTLLFNSKMRNAERTCFFSLSHDFLNIVKTIISKQILFFCFLLLTKADRTCFLSHSVSHSKCSSPKSLLFCFSSNTCWKIALDLYS